MGFALIRIGFVILAVGALGACKARTDRALYGQGDGGTTHIANGSRETIQVDCSIAFDRVVDGDWIPSGEQVLDSCRPVSLDLILANEQLFAPIDGSLAFPIEDVFLPIEPLDVLTLPPGGEVHSFFAAPRDPGRWRIRYSVGFGCSDAATKVGECMLEHSVETPPFGVEEFCAPEECVEKPPICDPIFFPLPFPLPESELVSFDATATLFLPSGDVEIFPFRPPPVPPACRRDLDTEECRWVCDDATPIPPPPGY